MALSVFSNIAKWAGSLLSPASNAAGDGSRVMPDVRSTGRKFSFTVNDKPLRPNVTYISPWYDTTQTGTSFVSVSASSDGWVQNSTPLTVEQTDIINDPSWPILQGVNSQFTTPGMVAVTFQGNGLTPTVSTIVAQGFVTRRYWRVLVAPGASTMTRCLIVATESQQNPPSWQPSFGNMNAGSALGASPGAVNNSNGVFGETLINTNSQVYGPGLAGKAIYISADGTATSCALVRTPNVFRGAQFSGTGANVIWMPPSTKKVRLMKYMVEVGEDATITSGPLPINLQFAQQAATNAVTTPYAACIPYTHRLVLPGTALATSFDGYQSGWVDLGHGPLLATAGVALVMGIQVPQSTAAIASPAWTIASNQWESATVGFKTNGNLGNFKLVQQNTNKSDVSALGFTVVPTITGNSIFVFFKTTNPVGGAPTVTVTDTALNTYTTGTLVTNASDLTNGVSVGMAYCINAIGNASNTVTVTTTVNLATSLTIAYLEYSGVNSGGGIDAAQVGATGNSASPASGNYTPATAGDLVFTFMSSGANLSVAGVVAPSPFLLRANNFQSTGGLAVADNFGNGSLATGQVNVVCCGTEE